MKPDSEKSLDELASEMGLSVEKKKPEPASEGGYVKTLPPQGQRTKEQDIEAQIADLNTKRSKDEGESNQRIGILKQLLAAAQTGSMGFGDEMAGVKSAIQGKGYRAGQQNAEREAKQAQDEYPLASVAGVAPMMLVPGGQGPAARIALASLLGGASTVGNRPGAISISDAKDVSQGAGKAALVQGGLELLPPVLKGAAKYLKEKQAPEWALKAAGLRGGISNRAQDLGFENADEARALGREFLDQGLIPVRASEEGLGKLLPIGGSKEGVATRMGALKAQSGNLIGQAIQKGEMSGVPPDFDEAMWAAIDPAMKATALERQTLTQPTKKLLRGLEESAATNPTWDELNRTKSALGKTINWKAQPGGAPALTRQAYGALEENIANQLNRATGDAGDMLRRGNKGFGTAAKGLALSNDQGLREMANQGINLKDVALGLGGSQMGSATSGPTSQGITAAALTALSKLIRERGPALGARVADDVAAPSLQALSRIPQSTPALAALPDSDRKRLEDYLLSLTGE